MKGKPVIAHLSVGVRHAVAAELRVLVMESEDGGFFAQGLEIDYVATGATEELAREHFAEGFVRTVRACIERKRDLGTLFGKSKTPESYWKAYYTAARKAVFGCVVTHDLGNDLPPDLPLPHVLSFHTTTARAS